MKLSRNAWLSAAVASVAVTAVVVGTVAAAGGGQTPPHASRPFPVASATTEAARSTPVPVTKHGLGSVIVTGLDASAVSAWVIKPVSVKVGSSQRKTFGFAMDEQANNGKLTQDLVISEATAGDELKTGFHALEPAYTLEDGVVQPAYGYFVGLPAKIIGTVDGKQVTATTAKWSADASVTVFWFDNTKVTGDSALTAVSAYDSAGKQLAKAPVSA